MAKSKPRKPLTEHQLARVEALAYDGLTNGEIALTLGIPKVQLTADGGVALARGRDAKATTVGEDVLRLAAQGMTAEDIALLVGMSRTTLYKRFRPLLDRGRAMRNQSLLEAMFDTAVNDRSAQMQIWLSKQWLGMRDPERERPDVEGQSADDLRHELAAMEAATRVDPPTENTTDGGGQ